jgi:hypothetical protein
MTETRNAANRPRRVLLIEVLIIFFVSLAVGLLNGFERILVGAAECRY